MAASVEYGCYYVCPINFSSPSLRQLMLHLRCYHDTEKSQFTCNIDHCQGIFYSVSTFRKHIPIAHADRWEGISRHNVLESEDNGPSSSPDISMSADLDGERDPYSEMISSISKQCQCHYLKMKYLFSVPEWKAKSTSDSLNDMLLSFKSTYDGILMNRLKNLDIPEDVEFILNDSVSLANALKLTKGDELKLLSEMGYIPPIEIVFSGEGDHKECGHYVPIKLTLQQYLSRPDVLASIKRETPFTNMIDKMTAGNIMDVHPIFSLNKSAIRLIFYTDEFQLGNPLGSKAKTLSTSGVYFSVNNIDSSYSSKLVHIHLAMLVKEAHLKKYSKHVVFRKLIDDLEELETGGIDVTVEGVKYHFDVGLSNCSGDNKSMHDIGGFSTCFSSGKICRTCLADFKELPNIHFEDQCTLRTREVHDYHVNSVQNDSTLSSVYGVTEASPFSRLRSFHPSMSLPPDIMHDVYEGVMPMNLTAVVKGLLKDKVFKHIAELKALFATFDYGSADMNVNDVACFPAKFPQKGSLISGTATEKVNLFYLFSLVVGPSVPSDNKYWQLHLKCLAVCDTLLAPKLKPEWVDELPLLVAEYLSLWSELPVDVVGSFKPKMHFLVHTASLTAMFGPLRLLSCNKFEHFHQWFKNEVRLTKNFINPTLTLSTSFQKRKCLEYCSSNIFLSAHLKSAQKSIDIKSLDSIEKQAFTNFFQTDTCMLVSVSKVKIQSKQLLVGEYVIVDTIP